MKRAFLIMTMASLVACGGDEPKAKTPATAATPAATTAPPPTTDTTAPPAASTAAAPATPPADDGSKIPADKMEAYVAIWKEWFAKENGITTDELGKRITVKKTESEFRNYSRTVLEVTFDVTVGWATIKGAQSELLTRIKARSSDPPPNVRFDTWLEASDYTKMKEGKALLTTRLTFGNLRFAKQADAEKAAEVACKGKKRTNEFQVAIAGDGDLWLVSLWQAPNAKENRPCGVDLSKNKGGEVMNFDAGEGAFK